MPLVSVILPVFNAAEFIDEAIQSLCSQTFSDFELLIVNDGSTDRTSELLRQWQQKDPRVNVFYQRNEGVVSSLNKLIGLAGGKYIARMDADDICFPERLATQLEYFKRDPALGVLGSKVQLINAPQEYWHYRQTSEQTEALLLLGNTPLCHPSIMVRREIYHNLLYRSDYPHLEDLDWFIRFLRRGTHSMYAASEILIKYRTHTGNISVKHRQLQQETRKILLANLWRSYSLTFTEEDINCFLGPLMADKGGFSVLQVNNSVRHIGMQLAQINPSTKEELARRHNLWLTRS